MTTLFSALDWRAMSQEVRDLGLNNGVAVPSSVEMVAGWEARSAEMRKRFPGHLDLRYGPRERNRIDFLKAGDNAPTLLFIHGGYWLFMNYSRLLILSNNWCHINLLCCLRRNFRFGHLFSARYRRSIYHFGDIT